MFLSRLVYYSRSRVPLATGALMTAEIKSILDAARLHNGHAGLTGALACDRTWFIQVLEGGRESLSETLARLFLDTRHEGLVVTEFSAISQRAFNAPNLAYFDDQSITPEICARFGTAARLDPPAMTAASLYGFILALSGAQGRPTPAV